MNPATVVRRFWAGYNSGQIDATWDQFIAEDVNLHPSAGTQLTRQSWKDFEKSFIASFASVRVDIEDLVCEGTTVATRWSLTATDQHTEFLGIAPKGGSASATAMSFDTVNEGKIVDHRSEVALAGFLDQLSSADPSNS